MKKSKFLQRVGNDDHALYYHSLFGRLFLLDREYISVLESENTGTHGKEAIIADLIDNGYLVDEAVDERLLLEECNKQFLTSIEHGANVTSLDLNISELCNFTCPHCMNGCQITNPANKLMTWDVAKKTIDEYLNIIRNNRIIGEIHFGSAEPLLNWKLIKQVVRYCKEKSPETPISINTNLSLLTREKAIFLRDNRVFIATSLDGPRQANDQIRIKKSGGTYDLIVEKMDMLSEIGYPLDGCSLTMNDLNINLIDREFIYFLKNRGYIGLATDIDLVNNKNCSQNIGFYIDKLISIYKLCSSLGMENFGSWTKVFHNLINQEDREVLTYCKAQSGRNLSVNPIGDVFLCGYSTTKVGNIFEFEKFFEKDQSYYALVASKLPGRESSCYGCSIEGICAGECLVTAEFSSEQNQRKSFLCDFYREVKAQLLGLKLAEEA